MHAFALFRYGFRAIFRAPALILAEITWRWSFGSAACLLVGLSAVEYLRSLPVSAADLLFLRSGAPWLAAQALGDILYGSGPRLVRTIAILVLALAIVGSVAAALGRAATMKVLLPAGRLRGQTLLGLSFLRTALLLATILAVAGAAILGSSALPRGTETFAAASDSGPGAQASLAVGLFMLLAIGVVYVWGAINWLLSVAPVFAARDGRDTLGAISDAAGAFRAHKGEFIGVSVLFALLHLWAMIAAGFCSLFAIGLLSRAGVIAMFGGASVVALLYFAAVDFLYIARLASYVAIIEDEGRLLTPAVDLGTPMFPVPTSAD